MTIRNLEFLFQPSGVVLAGASERPGSIGLHVAGNILRAGFSGEVGFINPHRSSVLGRPCYASVEALPFVPQLAIIAAPPRAVPGLVAGLGRKGCRAAIVITAGVTGSLAQEMRDAARPHLLRIVGPNCLGIQVPARKLDASFAQTFAKQGGIAVVSRWRPQASSYAYISLGIYQRTSAIKTLKL